ncbi:hypothetical protein ACF1DW_04300 [Streptomyces sp. NPDC014603]|jgi:hypothetical protein|uniref:hypothetical protein n=1 Tax=Streptomyces sp. NPDC014603 TaxID=3364873 RepID=UPI003701CAEE
MTDHDVRPERTASHPSDTAANLLRLCREDYEQAAARRAAQDRRTDAFLTGAAAEAVTGR